MIIRTFTREDLIELERLHSLYFKDEFYLPDISKYLRAFVVEDEKGIITMGGIRPIIECALVTDMSRYTRVRQKALYYMLEANSVATRECGFDQMYVWSQNSNYTKRLKENGFKSPVGDTLIFDL